MKNFNLHYLPIYCSIIFSILCFSGIEFLIGTNNSQLGQEIIKENPPNSAQTISSFISNPTQTDELVNPTLRTLPNGGFEHSETINSNLEDFYTFDEDTNGGFFFNRTSVRHYGSGTYSIYLEHQSNAQWSNSRDVYQEVNPLDTALDNSVDFSFDWYVQQVATQENNSDAIYIQVNFNTSQSLRYYVMGHTYNITNRKCITIENFNNTGAWYSTTRDIALDYSIGFGGDLSIVGVVAIDIYCMQSTIREIPIQVFFDNLALEINSLDQLLNGDFEIAGQNEHPTNWIGNEFGLPILQKSLISSSGLVSANLSNAIHPGVEGYSYVSCYQALNYNLNDDSAYVSSTRSAILSVDLYFSKLPLLATPTVMLRVGVNNASGDYQLNLCLLDPNFNIWRTNSSTNQYNNISVPSSIGQWNSLSFDLGAYFSTLVSGSFNITFIQILQTMGGYNTDTLEILWDNLGLEMSMVVDPEFENGVENAIPRGFSYSDVNGIYSAVDFAGSVNNLVANFSTIATGECSTSDNGLSLPLERFGVETHFSMDYMIPAFTLGNSYDGLGIVLSFHSYNETDELSLVYLLAGGSDYLYLTNETDTLYFFTEDFNISTSWMRLSRNIYRDISQLNASLEDFYLFSLNFYFHTESPSSALTLLVDNIAFGTGIPICEICSRSNSVQEYNHSLSFSADLFDSGSGIASISLKYRFSPNEDWSEKTMIIVSADEQTYSASLDAGLFHYNQTFEYYIGFSDSIGNLNQFPSDGANSPLSVFVDDFTAPTLNNLLMTPQFCPSDQAAEFHANVSDGDGSGIASVTLWYSLDGALSWGNATMILDSNTMLYTESIAGTEVNKILIYYVIVQDIEGNSFNSSATLQYGTFVGDLYYVPNESLKNIGIGMGIGAATLLTLEIIIHLRKKKKTLEKEAK